MKIISIFNNKGGVGKTTIAWNLADAMARKGKRVLMVDFDPQCNLSLAVLGTEPFTKKLPTQNVPYGTTIRAYLQRFLQNTGEFQFFSHRGLHTDPNAEIVAGDFWLNVYSESLNVGSDLLTGTGIAKYMVLRDMIDFANKREGLKPYDYAFIDLPPSFGALVRAALYSSDYFIVPCTSDTFSAYCVGLIGEMLPGFFQDWESGFKRFKSANPYLNKYDQLGSPKFAGWIFNGFDTRKGEFVKADQVHYDKISDAIKNDLVLKLGNNVCHQLPKNYLIGQTEDMNVLVQNSIWQNVPVSVLDKFRPIKTLQGSGNWSPNQEELIFVLRDRFREIADNIIKYCI
ncbi:ParA family protein [Microseira wollei]|uniref:Regulatory protein CII n=1 Tax=Microseira wollei NIES-4236 TaxID=2530354 RepID=A0AAV3XLX4_9CYAN|nr:ParA family protein [Microseira wollei]GET42556.1 regulatory protein CII [Microseira wollei NIES-4236]